MNRGSGFHNLKERVSMNRHFSFVLLPLCALFLWTGCDKTNKFNPSKGLEVVNRLKSAETGSDSMELAKLAVDQNVILKDRAGAMETMRKAVRFCSDIQDPRERIEVYSQIAASYSSLNALPEARKALVNAMNAYQSWDEEALKAREKSKKAPTQSDLENFADEKLQMLLSLAKAQMNIAPGEAQNTLMLAQSEAAVYSDILMRVDKMLDIASTLGSMESLDNLRKIAENIKASLNGEVLAAAPQAVETESAETSEDSEEADSSQTAENENADESEDSDVEDKEEASQEIDGQQKGSRLSTLAGIFISMKDKSGKEDGIKLLDEAVEVARGIDNRGKKAITLCEIALNYVKAGEKEKAKELVDEAEPFAQKADSATREAADTALNDAKAAVE